MGAGGIGALTLSAVRAFVAVARCGSTVGAAAELGFTQSAISRQVAEFERYVGTRLFGRSRGGMRLNPQGEALLPKAVALLQLANSMPVPEASRGGSGRPCR
ncbi:LysR family transcriptional regulator [Sinomonas susongensis]|uniref:LysR family transcriptional regulator n=1 Tax=Sinomonas susongensis TaxID=1324851 RepID=UPI001109C7A4